MIGRRSVPRFSNGPVASASTARTRGSAAARWRLTLIMPSIETYIMWQASRPSARSIISARPRGSLWLLGGRIGARASARAETTVLARCRLDLHVHLAKGADMARYYPGDHDDTVVPPKEFNVGRENDDTATKDTSVVLARPAEGGEVGDTVQVSADRANFLIRAGVATRPEDHVDQYAAERRPATPPTDPAPEEGGA